MEQDLGQSSGFDLQQMKSCAQNKQLMFVATHLQPFLFEVWQCNNELTGNVREWVNVAAAHVVSEEKEDFLELLEHTVAFHATHPLGPRLCDLVSAGLAQAHRGDGNTVIKFDDVTRIRQAYWTELGHASQPSSSHDVLRINDVPFAEGAWVHLLASAADKLSIALEVENIPWSEVGAALLTGRIDVAFHNDTVFDEVRSSKSGQWIDVLRTGKILEYDGYYLLGRAEFAKRAVPLFAEEGKDSLEIAKTAVAASSTAVVSPSDFRRVYADWLRGKEEKMIGVKTADEALSLLVDGVVDMCLAGAIQKTYAEYEFGREVVSIACVRRPEGDGASNSADVPFATRCRLWSVCKQGVEAKQKSNNLCRLLQAWKNVGAIWDYLRSSAANAAADEKRNIVTFVNKQPQQAFARSFDDIKELLTEHDDPVFKVDANEIKQFRLQDGIPA